MLHKQKTALQLKTYDPKVMADKGMVIVNNKEAPLFDSKQSIPKN